MIFPDSIRQNILNHFGNQTSIIGFTRLHGGCINDGGKLICSAGTYFVKWNDKSKYPGMLSVEAQGLTMLARTNTIPVPEVIHLDQTDDYQFLLLEFIENAAPSSNFWKIFGEQLAALHQTSNSSFGLDHDNYMGSLKQSNSWQTNWADFFIENRLHPQLTLAVNTKQISKEQSKKFEALYSKLNQLVPDEKPALVHGDLWSGNLLSGANGPTLIDPAVCYGNREADLAMTQLFGGFNQSYLDAYQNTFPLSPGFSERIDIYNLYPLLIHVNLFGGGYAAQVNRIVSGFS